MSARSKASMVIYGLNIAAVLFITAEAHNHTDIGIGMFFLSIFNALVLIGLKVINLLYRLFGGTPFTVMKGVREGLAISAVLEFLFCWQMCMG